MGWLQEYVGDAVIPDEVTQHLANYHPREIHCQCGVLLWPNGTGVISYCPCCGCDIKWAAERIGRWEEAQRAYCREMEARSNELKKLKRMK